MTVGVLLMGLIANIVVGTTYITLHTFGKAGGLFQRGAQKYARVDAVTFSRT